MARSGGVEHEVNYELRPQNPPLPQAASTEHFTMDDGEEMLAAGGQPPPLVKPRPREWVQRRTVEEIVEFGPVVQILDALVPQVAVDPCCAGAGDR